MGEEIYEKWKDQVTIITVLDNFYRPSNPVWPYSCEQWGDFNAENIPPIIDDGLTYIIHDWFIKPPDAEDYPMVYIIDQNMEVNTIQNESLSINSANFIFNDLLSNLSVTFNKKEQIPKNFNLINVYPNPFNPVLHINFELSLAGLTQVDILDIAGAHIETLHSGFFKIGSHELSWHAESMPSGMYLVSLKSGDESLIEKVVLLK